MAKKDTPANGSKGNGSVKKLRKLMKDIRIAMLTTVARDGLLHSRPMRTSDVEFDGTLWFIAKVSSGLGEDVAGNPNVCVNYANPKADRYISLTGTAEFVHDRGRLKELWNAKHKSWFPDGKKDPDLALLRIEVHFAEYWDASSDSIQLSQFVRPEHEPDVARAAASAGAGAEEPTGAGAQG